MVDSLDSYELDFASPPPEYLQLKCPICLEMLLDSSYLVSCCGNHICGTCIQSLSNAKTTERATAFLLLRPSLIKPCPLCKSTTYEKVIDKGHQRAVNSLKVYCSNKGKGCNWTGEVKQLLDHLSLDNGDCQHQAYDCKYKCGQKFFRSCLVDHQISQFCKKYSSTYEEVTTIHYGVCSQYSVRCPNDCGASVKRIVLDTHVSTHCPQRKVQCEFSGIGCKWLDSIGKLKAHLEEKWREHIALAMSHSTSEIKELKGNVNTLNNKVEELHRRVKELETPAGRGAMKSTPPPPAATEDRKPLDLYDFGTLRSIVDSSPDLGEGGGGGGRKYSNLVAIRKDSNTPPPEPSLPLPPSLTVGFAITSKGTELAIDIPHPSQHCKESLIVDRWHHKRQNNNLHRTPPFSIPTISLLDHDLPRFTLQVTVHCNGIKSGAGSHVSVAANIVWRSPVGFDGLFSGKLLIILESPIPSYEKKYGLIIFDDSVDDVHRKPSHDTVELVIEKFLSFDEVDCYLRPMNDSLFFKIYDLAL
uniref:RING-type domain-containing protein n=1 Tax=Amphimedon queenslandica TaxID=400682 RepID=A0A1X7V5E7_AMPQE